MWINVEQQAAFRTVVIVCVQKLLVTHAYKNLMTFGGCRQDLMLVVGQSIGGSTAKDKPTEKHLFAMDVSKVHQSFHLKLLEVLIQTFLPEMSSFLPALTLPCHVVHQVREMTLLVSSYINGGQQQKAAAHHLSAPALMVVQPIHLKSKEPRSRSPAALGRPSKTPTLL